MKIQIVNKTEFDLPKYETDGSVGMDLRADLTNYEEAKHHLDPDEMFETLEPRKVYIIPTGLYIALPDPTIEAFSGEGSAYEAQIRPRSGLAAKHGITIVNSPGTIDCFSEDSMIKTINGDKNIAELKINDVVLSVNNETFEIERDDIVSIIDKGEQDIYIIETEEGKLEITPNTIIYTEDGLKKASEITENDKIFFYK